MAHVTCAGPVVGSGLVTVRACCVSGGGDVRRDSERVRRRPSGIVSPWASFLVGLLGAGLCVRGLEIINVALALVGLVLASGALYAFIRHAFVGVPISKGQLVHIGWLSTTRVPLDLIDEIAPERSVVITGPVVMSGRTRIPLSTLSTLFPAGQARLSKSLMGVVTSMVSESSVEGSICRRFVLGRWRCMDA